MIDCNITTNYFAEKKRMVKLTDTGVCGIKCKNCPLSEKNKVKEGFAQIMNYNILKRQLRLCKSGRMHIRKRHFLRSS